MAPAARHNVRNRWVRGKPTLTLAESCRRLRAFLLDVYDRRERIQVASFKAAVNTLLDLNRGEIS
jgi:hypothetical protein